MIAAVMNFTDLKRTVIVVVIEPENMDRMRQADPITLETQSLGGVLPDIQYPTNYGILIAYEPVDEVELYKRARLGGGELLSYLERGRKFLRHVDGPEHSFKIPQQPGKPDDLP